MCLKLNNMRDYGIVFLSSSRHQQVDSNQSVSANLAPNSRPTCSVESCVDTNIAAKGLCVKHYKRLRRHGDPLYRKDESATEKGAALNWLLEAIATDTDECQPFPFARQSDGYPKIKYQGRTWVASRLVLFLTTGTNPPDMDAAHAPIICHNPSCCNKRHLRWATRLENERDKLLDGTRVQSLQNPRKPVIFT